MLTNFKGLNQYVLEVKELISSTAAATYIIYNNRIVNEWYSGQHDLQFNVGSVRKTYLGLVVGLALYEGRIKSYDDLITNYIEVANPHPFESITIRHLLTHTHGLRSRTDRFFQPGTDWKYNNVGVNLLADIIQNLYEKPFTKILEERVFPSCNFIETNWKMEGTDPILYTSARELAEWGNLHLNLGSYNSSQIFPRSILESATSCMSPNGLDDDLPRNGFFWFVQDTPRIKSELGEQVPEGSYQSLGITGCACLVIPKFRTVAVRMYNQKQPNPLNYDYLRDIKTFGNMVTECVSRI